MNTKSDILELRALTLAIAQQSLGVRRHILEVSSDQTTLSVSFFNQHIPKINWMQLQEQAMLKLARWQSSGIQINSYFEASYPPQLKNIEDPPLILFSKGKPLSLLAQHCCLAIVGSRRADSEGLELTQQFARELGRFGIVIVSGLALGIDGAAHTGALQAKFEIPTVAVLGSGLDVLYPPQHASLAQEIINSGGIIISQFEPDTLPYPSNFLNRNRLVSGLCRAVLVIEATLKSGSLVTARNALEQGKDVLVVPGDIHNPRFEGSNRLIQQGATLVTSVQDVVEALGIAGNFRIEAPSQATNGHAQPLASKIEKQILDTLAERREMRVDELVRQLGTSSFEKELLSLELRGAIKRLPGNVLKLNVKPQVK